MKRRALDASKLRRPVRRSRITDSVHGSWLLYLRFFIVWLLVITMDFLLEFRFEFLWPFWLMLRSTYDSFRYQGLGLTMLFLLITMCSDLLCLVLLPVHWLFFAASTYVWVQFVWSTDRGPCLPTVTLWLLFVYVEASVRLRELKSLPFHLDLCRPFAAHCIGYPVVSLGYGFKSYVGFKIRQYKQEEVSKENTFYMQLVSYALPVDMQDKQPQEKVILPKTFEDNCNLVYRKNGTPLLTNGINTKMDIEALLAKEASKRGLKLSDLKADLEEKQGHLSYTDLELLSSFPIKNSIVENGNKRSVLSEVDSKFMNGKVSCQSGKYNTTDSKRSISKLVTRSDIEDEEISDSEESTASSSLRSSQNSSPKPPREAKSICDALQLKIREEQIARRRSEQHMIQVEADLKRVRNDLTSSRQLESELRAQVNNSHACERYLKSEIARLKNDNETYQQKISSLNTMSKQDKSIISSLERKLKAEKDSKANIELQLKETRRKNKAQEQEPPALKENHDSCIARRQELEQEAINLQTKISDLEQKLKELEKDNHLIKKQSQENEHQKLKKETELLYSALTAMQGKNTHLENSLSSETRLKLDLFSALGDTRRQLEITQGQLAGKEREIDILKGKIAEVMAVMSPNYPESSVGRYGNHTSNHNHIEDLGITTVTTASFIPVTKNGIM